MDAVVTLDTQTFIGQIVELSMQALDGGWEAQQTLNELEVHLAKILGPFGEDVFLAASLFVSSLDK